MKKQIQKLMLVLFIVLSSVFQSTILVQAASLDPVFVKHPTLASTYAKNATIRLYVQATSVDNGYLTYQWKYSTSSMKTNPVVIAEGTKATLTTTSPATAGTYYYWAEVTNHSNGTTATIDSNLAEVTVVDRELYDSIQHGDFEDYRVYDTTLYYVPMYSVIGKTKYNFSGTINIQVTSTISADIKQALGAVNNAVPTTGSYFIYTADSGLSDNGKKIVGVFAGSATSPGFLPSDGYWDTTHYSASASEFKGIETEPGVHYMNGKNAGTFITDNASEPYYNGRTQNDSIVAELSAWSKSSLFQEIATVPGKIYEWSLDHGARSTTEIIAVVIGPAINNEADYAEMGITNRWQTVNLGYDIPADVLTQLETYRYGTNDTSYFEDVVDALASQEGVAVSQLSGEYTVTYGGKAFYVYISIATTTQDFQHLHGSYSVPQGQGTTVFGFVNVYSSSGSLGNLLDNIVFASGTEISSSQEATYSGDSSISIENTKTDYVYALAEVRASAVYSLLEKEVYFTPDGGLETGIVADSSIGDGITWYYPNDTGTLTFKNLVPGKTYRVIGIPKGTVDKTLGTNLNGAAVLDEGYYQDVVVEAGTTKSTASEPATITTGLYDNQSKGRIIIGATDNRSQYTLLDEDGYPLDANGNALTLQADGDDTNVNWIAGNGGSIVFENLIPGKKYRILVRPDKYQEQTWDVVKAETSGIIYALIPQAGEDILENQVSRSGTDGDDRLTLYDLNADYTYLVYEPSTGEILETFTGVTHNRLENLDPQKTYQVVVSYQKDGMDITTVGVRAYPRPEDRLYVDYIDELVYYTLNNENIPDTLEYQMFSTKSNNVIADAIIPYFHRASGTNKLRLNAPLPYVNNGVSVLDAVDAVSGATGSLLYYRHSNDSDYVGPYVAPTLQLLVGGRPEAPTNGDQFTIDWVNEKIIMNSPLQILSSSGTWEAMPSEVSFADLGWDGLADVHVSLRIPADSDSFASKVADVVIVQRPDAPEGIGGTYNAPLYTLDHLIPNTNYQYSLNVASGNWIDFIATGDTYDISGSIGSVRVYLRYSATDSAPASLYAGTIEVPLSMADINMRQIVYGEVLNNNGVDVENTGFAVHLKNLSSSHPADISAAVIVSPSDVFEVVTLESLPLSLDISGSGNDTNTTAFAVRVKPGLNLNAGSYEADLSVDYELGGEQLQAHATVILKVVKADYNTGSLKLDSVSATETTLNFDVTGIPSGAPIEYSLDNKTWSSSPNFNNLTAGSEYELYVRIAGDANHNTTPGIYLGVAYTQQPTPVFDEVLYVNFYKEALEFKKGVNPTLYEVRINGVLASANEDLSSLADVTDLTITLTRKGTDDALEGPETSNTVTNPRPILKRASAPAGITTTAADTPANNTGTIHVPGASAFEYRANGSNEAWTHVTGDTAANLSAGTYEVRIPATDSAFASEIAHDIKVKAVVYFSQPALKWEATSATLSVFFVDGGAPYVSGTEIEVGTQLRFEITANDLGAVQQFYQYEYVNGIVQTTNSHEDTLILTVNSSLQVDPVVSAFLARTVTYNKNHDGVSGSIAASGNSLQDPDYTITLSSGSGFVYPQSYYAVRYWNTQSDGQGNSYEPGSDFEMTQSTQELFAVWMSTDARIKTIAGVDELGCAVSGTIAKPTACTAAFVNSKDSVVLSDFVKNHDLAEMVVYQDASFTTPLNSFPLSFEEGQSRVVYIKVVPEDERATAYYKITLTRKEKSDEEAVDWVLANLEFNDFRGENQAQDPGPSYEVFTQLATFDTWTYNTNISWSLVYHNPDTEERSVDIDFPSYSESMRTATLTATVSRGDVYKTKTFELELQPLPPDTTLKSLLVSAGALSPVFDPEVQSYSVTVPYGQASINIEAELNNPLEAVLTSGTGTFLLNVGNNTFTVVVTGLDGISVRVYTLIVVRQGANRPPAIPGVVPPTGVNTTVNWLLPLFGTLLIWYLGVRQYKRRKSE